MGRKAAVLGEAAKRCQMRAPEASDARFRALFEYSPDAVFVTDGHGCIQAANPAACAMFDMTEREICERGRDGLIDMRDPRIHELLEVRRRTGSVINREVTFVRKSGERFEGEASSVILPGDGSHAFVIVRDISERKRAEDVLRTANAKLAAGDRRKDEFLAVLSHELRNPLAPIRYALEIVQARSIDDAGTRALGVIERQLDQLTRLVDDLLDLSRITRGKIELRRESITLASVVTTASDAVSPAMRAARHALDIVVPEEPIWLCADGARISQVLTNLLANSAKYTPPGGRILLAAERQQTSAVVRVRDNGIGISAEALPAVFDMFTQLGGQERSQGGLGIGLALVKRLVEMHGGTIEARSAGAGQGAEFVVTLPVAPKRARAGPELGSQAARPGGCVI